MSRLLRSAAAAALIALAFLAVPGANPATAAAPSLTVDSPVADSTQLAPFTISGSASQSGPEATITSVNVRLSNDDGWTTPEAKDFPGSGASAQFSWSAIAPKYNGPYTVTATANGRYRRGFTENCPRDPADTSFCLQSTVVSKSFHVEIPPATPTGVTADKPEESTAVTVKWKANPEPDIAGYVVYRSYAGDAGKKVGSVEGTKLTYTDDLVGKAPGQYKYAVQAVRHARSCKSTSNTDEACSRGIAGKNSAYSAAVTVRATAPTTTTTTIKKPSSGGSTGGGSNSGGTTTTTIKGSTGSGTSSSGAKSDAAGVRRGTGGAGFSAGGEVDLSEFGSLLNPSSRNSGATRRPGEDPGTFDETLPYGERAAKPAGKNDDTLITIGGASLPKPSDDWVKFIGAGSLATALLVHVLWFKQQVDAIPLETLGE